MKKLSLNVNFNNQSGQMSRVLIILAAVLLVVIVVVFFVIQLAARAPQKEEVKKEAEQVVIEPEYETTMGDTRFLFISANNLGNVIEGRDDFFQKDLITTEKFIRVTVGAQNKGKNNLNVYSWDVGNLVDSDGRNFVSINQKAYYSLPQPDLCGALLKPEFEPTPCVKIYEVSKASSSFKVTVTTTNASNRKQAALIDIIVK